MKTIDDALNLRRRIFGAFEMAEVVDDQSERDAWMTFVVVGGGPTGVEVAGQVRSVLCRGSFVIDERRFVGRAGHGRFVERSVSDLFV